MDNLHVGRLRRYICEICGKTGIGTTLKMPASFSTYRDHDVCKECCVNRRKDVLKLPLVKRKS